MPIHCYLLLFIAAAPNEVAWESDGCKTVLTHEDMTECHCNHLTYFSILVVSSLYTPSHCTIVIL